MSTRTRLTAHQEIEYPETDGEPIAENTQQFRWITKIKGGLDIVFAQDPNVFVAGDLFWYPLKGDNRTRRAPDVMVAFGRPKGDRGGYLQWLEEGVAPQVVFEILSPSNRGPELARKFQFYETFGVEEYYIYDPDDNTLEGWLRDDDALRKVAEMNGWTSPRLGVHFDLGHGELRLYMPDGRPFLTMVELHQQAHEHWSRAEEQTRQAEERRRRADDQERQAEERRRRADDQERQAEEQRLRVERLTAQLKALGIEPEL